MWIIFNILLAIFSVLILSFYLGTVLQWKHQKFRTIITYTGFAVWQFYLSIDNSFSGIINLIITIMIVFLIALLVYNGSLLQKSIFVIGFNAIWMLMEIFCGNILLMLGREISQFQILGSMISKCMLLIFIIVLKWFLLKTKMRELPMKYNIILMIIPIGSILVVNNIFRQSYELGTQIESVWSIISSCVMLLMNIIIFYMYSKIADELELRRTKTVYMRQMELYERQQNEREISMSHIQEIHHNMKNNLISIIAYAQNGECDKIIEFADEVLGMKDDTEMVDTGNMVIDSLINYWWKISKRENISFTVELNIPERVNFHGADLSMILGNALENAVEAARKCEKEKSIVVHIKYDKRNLFISILNTYNGVLLKKNDGNICSSKKDAKNHGIGIKSIQRTAEKYQGVVKIESSSEKFLLKILLYGIIQKV